MHLLSQTIQSMIDNTPGYSLDTLLADLRAGKQDDELLTSKEVCDTFKISRRTLNRLKARGCLKGYLIGGHGHPKYKKSEVLQALVTE